MKYELSYELWQKIDKLCDKLAGETLDSERRVRFWKEYFITKYNLRYVEDYEEDSDYGILSGHEKDINWFLLNL